MTAARTVYSLQQAKVSPLNYTAIEASLKTISKTDFVTKNKDDGVQNLDWDAGSVPEELPEVEEQVKKCIIQGLAGADDASYAESFPGDLDLTTQKQLDAVKQFIDQQRKQIKGKRKHDSEPDMEEVESHAAESTKKKKKAKKIGTGRITTRRSHLRLPRPPQARKTCRQTTTRTPRPCPMHRTLLHTHRRCDATRRQVCHSRLVCLQSQLQHQHCPLLLQAHRSTPRRQVFQLL